ncbi:MAG: T9SS type A sorting domain-containing protein [Bacteroidales bacterium]|nr:T9SS type A sorting domain-containing protein [Bacteroidales bacterium]
MKRNALSTLALLFAGLLFGTQALAQGRIELGRANSAQSCADVTDGGFTAHFSFSSIEATDLNTEKGVFSCITMPQTYPSGEYGTPQLPAARQLLALPFGAKNVSVDVKNYSTTTYRLADYGIKTLSPRQPSVSKSAKPEDIKFVFNEQAYASKAGNRPIAELEIQGNLRGIGIASLTVNPVNYDPVENTITVYNDIELEVRYNDYDKAAAYDEFARTFSPYFAGIYKQMFNWRDDVYEQHPDLWQAPVSMLVIADRMFEETLQEWIAWKTTKGFYLNVKYTDEIGSTAAAIKAFVQDEYSKDAPTFLIIVGDKNQVPASATGSQSHCVTDLEYESVDGDMFPDIFHSRMPVENTDQLNNVLTKSLMYDRYQMPDPSYLRHTLLIAGADSNWNPQVGQPTINYATTYYYNAEHNVDPYVYLHSPYTGCYNHLNTGVAFANYTAHGSNSGWADPSLSVSDVNNMTNEGMPFLAMGNCCEAADWGISGTCFGEAMIRANTRAAYAYIGSCPVTYWYEDYYFGVGATHTFNSTPTFEESATGVYDGVWMDDTYHTVASMLFIGNLAVTHASTVGGYQTSASPLYYWQAYHVLGDASIMPYRTEGIENQVNHMAIFPIGLPTFEVSALPGSYVSITKDGVIHGTALVDESGVVNVPIQPVTTGGEVTICVTGPQFIPYIANVTAAALEGPYVAVDSYTPANVHVGEQTSMSVTFKNVGTQPTGGTTNVALTCSAPELTIINGTASFENLAPEATVEVDGFTYNIAQGVADGTRFTIQINATCGSEVWEGKAIITAGEAVIEFVGMADAGGFVPGETIAVTASFENSGHYMATNAIATLTSENQYVTIENATYEIGTIDPTGIGYCVFNVNVAANCPETEQIVLNFTVNADGGLIAEGTGMLKNACNVIFDLADSYGDGWNGAKLNVAFSDGSPSQSLTINSGLAETYVIEIGNGVTVSLTWTSGNWDSECSFVVKYEDGTQICQASSPNSSWSYQFDCNCAGGSSATFEPVSNLAYSIEPNKIVLTWDAPENAMAYVVMRNGIVVGAITTTTFTDDVDKEGSYTYCVIAGYGEEDLSAPECIIVEAEWGIEENEAEFGVYPNPASNMLTINSGNAEFSYAMFNGMGQQVAAGNAHGTAQVNVSGMAKGVYFLRLTTGAQTTVQKVVVE